MISPTPSFNWDYAMILLARIHHLVHRYHMSHVPKIFCEFNNTNFGLNSSMESKDDNLEGFFALKCIFSFQNSHNLTAQSGSGEPPNTGRNPDFFSFPHVCPFCEKSSNMTYCFYSFFDKSTLSPFF